VGNPEHGAVLISSSTSDSSFAGTVGGVALVVLAVVLLALAVMFAMAWRRNRHASRTPQRILITATGGVDGIPHGTADLAGTLVNANSLHAPLTGHSCLVWEVTLLSEFNNGEEITYHPEWVTGAAADVEIMYDQRKTGRSAPEPQPGSVSITGDRIRVVTPEEPTRSALALAHGGSQLREPDVVQLRELGLPAQVADAVLERPSVYRVTEAVLRHGDFVRLRQGPLRAPTDLPDLRQTFQVVPLSQERVTAAVTGLLAAALGVGAVISAVLAAALLT
jgi:hypothetical protein